MLGIPELEAAARFPQRRRGDAVARCAQSSPVGADGPRWRVFW